MKFIICAPRYEPSSGGSIVLYKLARVLERLGHETLIWPWHLMPRHRMTATIFQRAMYMASRLYRPRFRLHPDFTGGLAMTADLDDSIVVYPETISGNPLQSKRYVRWILYKPGENGAKWSCSPGDLYFCFQEAFNVNCDEMRYGGVLKVTDWMTDVYHHWNFGPRSGVCYMLRKGKWRPDLDHTKRMDIVDKLSHSELAHVFNARSACYFFDPYTAYSEYAALCGCIPIVVPMPGVDKETWTPTEGGRPGVAYGDSDVDNAIASRPLLLQKIEDAEQASIESVQRFVSIVRQRHDSPSTN